MTGVGHARLILEPFGKFWGAFSVMDLFILNALTMVTEFIGISFAVSYLGLPKVPTAIFAAVAVIGAVSMPTRFVARLIGLSPGAFRQCRFRERPAKRANPPERRSRAA